MRHQKQRLIKKFVGQISLSDGFATVTDPCYEHSSYSSVNIAVHRGAYNCYAYVYEDTPLKIRILQILAANSEAAQLAEQLAEDDSNWSLKDYASVDSGQVGVFQYKPDFNRDEWRELCKWTWDEQQPHNPTGTGNCFIRVFEPDGNGYWVRTDDGDYPIYVLNADRETIGIELQL